MKLKWWAIIVFIIVLVCGSYYVIAATGSASTLSPEDSNYFDFLPAQVKGIAVLVAGIGLGLAVLVSLIAKYIFNPISRELSSPPTNPDTGKPKYENLYLDIVNAAKSIDAIQNRLNGLDERSNQDDRVINFLRESLDNRLKDLVHDHRAIKDKMELLVDKMTLMKSTFDLVESKLNIIQTKFESIKPNNN